MMRQMRDATKPIMILVAFAFIGLMVFTWGMDITGQSALGIGDIGRVNGDAVTYDAWQAAYRNLYDQIQRSQEQPVTTQQNKEIEDAAFDEVVNQLLIGQELRRRGIRVTDQEIIQAAQLSPPADLRPQFTSEETGQFDITGYQAFLASLPPEQLMLLEAYYRDVIPRGKLLRQVSSGIYLSDAELWQLFRDNNEQVEVRFVALDPATRYEDSDFDISEADTEGVLSGPPRGIRCTRESFSQGSGARQDSYRGGLCRCRRDGCSGAPGDPRRRRLRRGCGEGVLG